MQRSILRWMAVKIMFASLVAGCTGRHEAMNDAEDSRKAEYRLITEEEARSMMAQQKDAVILDVRTLPEFESGHIPGASLIPYTELGTRAPRELPDRDATILIYCRSGRRSAIAARELADLDYRAVYDFGGILDWTGEIVQPQLQAPSVP